MYPVIKGSQVLALTGPFLTYRRFLEPGTINIAEVLVNSSNSLSIIIHVLIKQLFKAFVPVSLKQIGINRCSI